MGGGGGGQQRICSVRVCLPIIGSHTHTHKHSCSLVSCDPLIRARFGPTVGHINLQLQQQADASNLAMYTRVYAHIHIHMYELYINTHIHTYTHIFSSYFALSTVRCPCPFIPCLDNFSMSEICAPV